MFRAGKVSLWGPWRKRTVITSMQSPNVVVTGVVVVIK